MNFHRECFFLTFFVTGKRGRRGDAGNIKLGRQQLVFNQDIDEGGFIYAPGVPGG